MPASRPVRATILAAAIAVVAVAAPAAAATVEQSVTTGIRLDIALGGASQACGFRVELHSIGKEVSIRQYNADGTLRSEKIAMHYDGYVLNPANGKTIPSRVSGPDTYRYNADGTIDASTSGSTVRTAPGYGIVSGFIGHESVTLVPTGEVDEDGFPIYDEVDGTSAGLFLGNEGMCAILS
jgi:hypothetical protein